MFGVKAAIADNKIAVFSKSWCPYCGKAKKLLESEFPNVQKVIFEYVYLVGSFV